MIPKQLCLGIFTFFSCYVLSAQVGVGNTNPQASLDITASNTGSPANNDGILVPRMSAFPANPGTRDGMLIYYTGATASGKGFYYWESTGMLWIAINTENNSASNGITETAGDMQLGGALTQNTTISQDTNSFDINLDGTGNFAIQDNGADVLFVENTGDIGFGTDDPEYLIDILSNSLVETRAINIQKTDNTGSITSGIHNVKTSNGNGLSYGLYNNIRGTGNGRRYGTYNVIGGGGTAFKYGTYNFLPTGGGTGLKYGTYNDVAVSEGWAGYFVGRNYISERLSIGELNNPNALLNIQLNSDGTYAHVELEEEVADESARLRFTNAVETDNRWVINGRADNTEADARFNIFFNSIAGGTGGSIFTVTGSGNVGIMRTPTTNTLEVNGTASKSAAGGWAANSDRRLKKNINTISGSTALEKLSLLRGVTYFWNDTKTGIERPTEIQFGFIAQELMEVFPEKVTKDNLGYYQTAYGDYDALFVQAIKELKSKVENLETENKNLKQQLSKLEQLEARLLALENNTNNTYTSKE